MLSAGTVSLGFGGQQVLSDVSLTLDRASRAGLVGANGSGKTSLLRILAGLSRPDSGTVTRSRAATVAYLPQNITLPPEKTVFEIAEEGYQKERELLAERDQHARILIQDPHNRSATETVARIDDHLVESGYHERHAQISRVLRGLGFAPESLHQQVGTLSGGWTMRVVLARTLLTRPDLLLLDEPTNYLDSESRLWLTRFLTGFAGGYVLVSHDRAFLDETVGEILELFQGTVKRYRGTYTEYEIRRAAELEQLIQRWEEQQREIARQEQFIRRFRAQANKARQVQSRVKMLEKTELLEIPEHLRPLTIHLPPPPHTGKTVLELQEISRRYDTHTVLHELTLTIDRKQRLAVVGKNGAGKSTLLRILAGEDRHYDGALTRGTGVKIGYFAQDCPESLPRDITVIQYLENHAHDDTRPGVREILGAFLFSGDAVEKPLHVLSGGERTRLAMAALLVRPLNVLILDEPTNHLDMTSQEVLARALKSYGGTVVFVSHDRDFLRSVATDVLALWPDTVHVPRGWQLYPGSYSEFEASSVGAAFFESNTTPLEQAPSEAALTGSGKNGEGIRQYEARKNRKSEIRRLQRLEAEQLEQIERDEREISRLHEEMAIPEVYTDGEALKKRQSQISKLEKSMAYLHDQWEVTVKRLEELDI